jgi:hypothetical protein
MISGKSGGNYFSIRFGRRDKAKPPGGGPGGFADCLSLRGDGGTDADYRHSTDHGWNQLNLNSNNMKNEGWKMKNQHFHHGNKPDEKEVWFV